ncbi:hypothetical protein NEHOM01_2002 [Nematocida homosporus]|uniref:uncharacterized protein n=1 Tax=Nematocida homosporus TaxID=1912981 RepID=UPI00221E65F8|nr:uncharacterized protein NEHOM01_2002 [Nematocida homosporus]KAI5187197.1 hypothetical protein NEHOM01_2002 [Nematocida homosporus]
MDSRERERKCDELSNGIIALINQMQSVSDGLYKHTYDLDTPLPQINKGVLKAVEKVLHWTEDELLVSEKAYKYIEGREPEVNAILEYIESEEQKGKELKERALGKSKYFRMLYQGLQRTSEESE